MEKTSLDNIEIGQILWNKPLQYFSMERGKWQDIFQDFLSRCNFDYAGYYEGDEEKFIRKDKDVSYIYSEENIPDIKEIKEKGVFNQLIGDYEALLYNNELYIISQTFEEKYYRDLDRYYELEYTYYNSLDKWLEENGYETEEDIPKGNIIPSEISCLKPMELDKDKYQKFEKALRVKPKLGYVKYFDNGVFSIRPFYWGESEDMILKPNFKYKDIEINWYKYPLRGATINKDIDFEEFEKILKECENSLIK